MRAVTVPSRCRRTTLGARVGALVVVAGLAGGPLPLVPSPASAAPAIETAGGAPVPAATSVAEQPDHFSEVYANPLDFDDAADLLLDPAPTQGLTEARVAGGELRATVTSPGYLSPVWGGYPGALYLGREGGAPENRVDTDRYTRLSFAAFVDKPTAAGLMWWNCEGLDPACQGGRPFQLEPGWNVYDLELRNEAYGLPKDWDGDVTGLRLAITPSGPTELRVDWMRLTADGGASLDWDSPVPGRPATLHWDADDDDANNLPGSPGWGAVPCDETTTCTTTGPATTDVSFLPPGRYRFWAESAGTRTPVSSPLEVRARPRPVVVDPDVLGGPDYATEVLGNPWDFADAADVAETGNARDVSVGGGRVWGTNASNDPYVAFGVGSGSRAIDATRYTRLTVTSGYEGGFDLRDVAGGGSHGRVVWRDADEPGEVRQTKEWVTYTGLRSLTYDLGRPTADVHETDLPGRWWPAAPKTMLRWDPNEDRGARRWWVEDAALRADDETGGDFVVRWLDTAATPGSRVDIYADDDRSGFDGQRIATRQVGGPGTQSWTWDTDDLPEGRYWVHVEITSAAGDTGRAYSTGPVRIDRSLPGQSPSPTEVRVRDVADACPTTRVPETRLSDVPAGATGSAVSCLAWWGVTNGTADGRYDPTGTVTRGQMATFLARLVPALGGALSYRPVDTFTDDDDSTHAASIDLVAAAGVVSGYADGTFRPDEVVTRGQMATFLGRAWELVDAEALPWGPDAFADDDGSPYAEAIDQAAAAGIAGGRQPGTFGPDVPVRRDQMASFITRLLDYGVQAGRTTLR